MRQQIVDLGERLRQQETAELLTAAPTVNLSVASANAEGTSNYFARADHSHAITSSSAPGAAASILATDAAGSLALAGTLTLSALGAGYVKSSAVGLLSVAAEVPLIDLGSYTQGDLIYGGGADWQDLAHPGAANRVLQSTAAEVGWSANAVTFPAAGATVVGTGGANQVAYWSGVNTITGDAGMTYNAGTDSLTVGDCYVTDGGMYGIIGAELLTFNAGANNAIFSGCDIGIGAAPIIEFEIERTNISRMGVTATAAGGREWHIGTAATGFAPVGTTAGDLFFYDDTANTMRMNLSDAGECTASDFFVDDGGMYGITGNELLTFNAAGNATFSGVGSVVVPDGAWVGADAACSWVFDSANGDVTTLDKVGIGTAAPPEQLTVEGTAYPVGKIRRTTALTNEPAGVLSITHESTGNIADGFGGTLVFHVRDGAIADTEIGYIGAARADGADTKGSLIFATANGAAPTIKVYITPGGNVTIPALSGLGNDDLFVDNNGTLINDPSDARFKSNVEALPDDALVAICGLRGVSYDWNESVREVGDMGCQRQVGLIAQEVEPYIPLAVNDSPKGYKTVSAKKIIPYLVEAIKAQQAQIEALQGAL